MQEILPLNDTQHPECRNPGFEQELPQILQLPVSIKIFCSQKRVTNFKKKNEDKIYGKKEVCTKISYDWPKRIKLISLEV